MACAQSLPEVTPSYRSGIRVLVADSDGARRTLIARVLRDHGGYELLADAGSREEWQRIAFSECPELVICSACTVEGTIAEQPFPLCITIGKTPVSPDRLVCALEEPICETDLNAALSAATVRILSLKAAELSSLIRQYVLHSDDASHPLRLSVEREGERLEIDTDDVQWIKAAGNYIRLYTAAGIFERRESIRSVAARLERGGFLRIHRGTVVNRAAIRSRVMNDDFVTAVELAGGTRLQVGPNYRDLVPRDIPVSALAVS
jgi:hypothetical protein